MRYRVEINQKIGKKISKDWLSKIIQQTLNEAQKKSAEVSIAIVGDAEMKRLNKSWRDKNKVTDVLSFTYESRPLAGEIIICYPQAARQAKESGQSVKEEIKLLLVHGLLHLCGHDHEKGLKTAERMRKMEKIVLKKLLSRN